jgi:S1-C subfamily serine protease
MIFRPSFITSTWKVSMVRKTPWILVTLIVVLTSFACNFSTGGVFSQAAPTPVQATVASAATLAPLPNGASDLQAQDQLLTALYERVDPGVVSIRVLSDSGSALGSGFVVDKEGHIVTNYHVVDGASDLEVDFPSAVKVHATVIGTDTDSDIAVVKVSVPADTLVPLTMGDSNQVKVGQSVIAIGNPFGLTSSMTLGIVSARGRTLESIRQTASGQPFSAGGLIQTDAAINPGNSGGPLLDLKGNVIGINRAIYSTTTNANQEPQNSGVGFAVPINIVKRVLPSLIKSGHYDYPYLGVTSSEEISLFEQEQLGLPQSTGAYIQSVATGGPADKAGLKGGDQPTQSAGLQAGGDLIIAADGHPVRVFGDLLEYLMENKSPGDKLVVTIIRNKQQKEVTITLGKRP